MAGIRAEGAHDRVTPAGMNLRAYRESRGVCLGEVVLHCDRADEAHPWVCYRRDMYTQAGFAVTVEPGDADGP